MAKPNKPHDADTLIARAKSGDSQALAQLQVYGAKYLRWSAKHPNLRAPTRPSDVGGDATLDMVEYFRSFRGTTLGEFEAWLSTIVKSRAFASIRRAKRRTKKVNPVASLDDLEAVEVADPQGKRPSATMAQREDWEELYIAIARLPKDQRDAVRWMQLDGASVAEVAERMKKKPTAVAGLIQRGVNGVRAQMAPDRDGAQARMPRGLRESIIAALLEYMTKFDAGEQIDVDQFIASRLPGNAELRLVIEWERRIREIGGKEKL
jgi:RNA polymerase sigma-70 factor, ECF subfamily